MRNIVLCLSLICGLSSATIFDSVASSRSAVKISLSESSGALRSAYDALQKRHLEQDQDTVVISRHTKFIVVSFLINDPDVTGGTVHAVYDPVAKKIIHVAAEQ